MARASALEARELLLVEDNPGDIHLFLHALRRIGAEHHHVSTVSDGDEALAFLAREGQFAESKRPDLIVLDLNLPRRSGRELLAAIKADARYADIPVVVLTTSEAERDIRESYALKANCYVTKPVELHDFVSTIRSIEAFWCHTVRLPRRADGVLETT